MAAQGRDCVKTPRVPLGVFLQRTFGGRRFDSERISSTNFAESNVRKLGPEFSHSLGRKRPVAGSARRWNPSDRRQSTGRFQGGQPGHSASSRRAESMTTPNPHRSRQWPLNGTSFTSARPPPDRTYAQRELLRRPQKSRAPQPEHRRGAFRAELDLNRATSGWRFWNAGEPGEPGTRPQRNQRDRQVSRNSDLRVFTLTGSLNTSALVTGSWPQGNHRAASNLSRQRSRCGVMKASRFYLSDAVNL